MKYSSKLYNIIFWFCCFALIAFSASNFTTTIIRAVGGEVFSGAQVGGRITDVSKAGCLSPPSTPDPTCVLAGCSEIVTINGIVITPYGYSAVGICPLIEMPTMFGVTSIPTLITEASVGWQIFGLFIISTPVISTPYGIIGTSL